MHHGRLNQYSFLHHDKEIVLHPMSLEAIMHNDVAAARKTKSHDHAQIANHIAAKDGEKHENTHRNSVASKKNEITLKGGCLLSTKSEINGLLVSNSVSYALIYKDALISLHDMQQSLPPMVSNILQKYADVFPSEVPSWLPLLRSIEHQIDLIPGASLQKYADVFPSEVPSWLPLLRSIEHQIDLIPGASLSNRAPYQTYPEETKEIHR
jgi:hypothetical protein